MSKDFPMIKADEIPAFLRSLYGETFPGLLSIWTKQDKRTKFFSCNEIDEVVAYGTGQAEQQDVYFGIGLLRNPRCGIPGDGS